ncbi:hypothetical protein PQD73_gp085 [Stenotrophomonas phage Salva]|uniref:Uncharacterized protein n=1 Tax=Stenotrophomonas phage Salva TaxID=2801524 RepID=A0A8B6Q899_9CAUD|nr:hypothetical protein PQD73_gp085 [Stenotrophomonas phage Salva]QQM18254.1 hypothetical protein CPT_Salva_091 [Stenotrophomonas phage Salva]
MKVTKYTGIVNETTGWHTLYSLQRDDGGFTESGTYDRFFKIGEDRYVAMPYWHDQDFPIILSASEVMEMIALK